MQIFGQVWLWSLGSFLLGVLFTWLLLVRPTRKRLVELEDAALRPPRQTATGTRVAPPVAEPAERRAERPAEPTRTDQFLDDLFDHQKPALPHSALPPPPPPQAPPAPPPVRPVVQEPPVEATQTMLPVRQVPVSPAAQSGPTAPPEPPIPDENDTELSDAPFQQFTQSTTVFVPPELPRQPEPVATGEDWFVKEDEEEADPHAITDVEDDEVVDDRGTVFSQHTTPISANMIRSLDESRPEPVHEPEPEPEPVQAAETTQYIPPAEPAEAPAEVAPEPKSSVEVSIEPVAEPLPVRVPARKREAPEPAVEPGRSLFEPVVPVGEHADEDADDFVPPGPFGPGSAMPLPGGGAPAPDFNVKASVTALRYCTQDNPQFDRIVAEVWFRTPSDAERVGFRVLS